jgi:hypothetical protein
MGKSAGSETCIEARSLEQTRRIKGVLDQLEAEPAAPTCLRELRGLELLESLGTSEARTIVTVLANGHEDALVTREARLVLARWRGKD